MLLLRNPLYIKGFQGNNKVFRGREHPKEVNRMLFLRPFFTFDNLKRIYPMFAVLEEWTLETSLSFSKVSCRICSLSRPISSACCIILASFLCI